MAASSWVHVLPNLQPLPAKIALSPLLPQRWQPFAMQPVNLPSYIVAKAISASALQLLNGFLVYVIQFLSGPRSLCKQDLPPKF
jgi:hypothetical protein